MIGKKERKVSPKNVNNRAGVNGARGSVSKGKMSELREGW